MKGLAARSLNSDTSRVRRYTWFVLRLLHPQRSSRTSLTGSLCVCSCLALSDELENLFGHLSSSAYLQPKGLSPVCERWWILRFSSRAKERVQPSNWGERERRTPISRSCWNGMRLVRFHGDHSHSLVRPGRKVQVGAEAGGRGRGVDGHVSRGLVLQ